MPCSKYKGKQRRACYATNEWKHPVRKRTSGNPDSRKHGKYIYRIYVKPEGEPKYKLVPNYWFKNKQDASTFTGIETIAGMGEVYTYKKHKVK